MADGISNSGEKSEAAFRRITGATKPKRAADGDAVLNGVNIEVKHASSTTLNQVRAVKYIPLVAHHSPTSSWFVIPAPDIVVLVAQKPRGQHTENPFESATLNISKLGDYRVKSEHHLKAAVQSAIKRADKFPELRQAMHDVLAQSKSLAKKSRADVLKLIDVLGL